jgi:murein DD-endopeptidase MepM/ murein hydrolase activator NlpD
MWAACSLAIGATSAVANSPEQAAARDLSLIHADAQRGTLKVDEQANEALGPPTATTDVPPASSQASRVDASPVAWVPSGMPVVGVRLSSRYGWRIHPIDGVSGMHRGVDLASEDGSPVVATAEGTVSRAEWYGGYGLFVEIDHGARLATRYAHLSGVAVSEGQRIKKGQVLGYVGSTGRSTGPHLHYEVRMAGEAVDPTAFLVPAVAETSSGHFGGAEQG